MPTTKTKPRTAQELPGSYEAAVLELEGLIAKMESGQVPLNELLEGHQRASHLLKYCQDRLREVEQQVTTLVASANDRGVSDKA